jgi:hypothetical protein
VAVPIGRKGRGESGDREVEARSSARIPPFSGIMVIRALLSTIFCIFNGIPCKVPLVGRLEGCWYAVIFCTDERWGKPKRDCGVYD